MTCQKERTILLADCLSFYASVEKTAHPEFRDLPVVVAGDPARRSGIILAACPIAKDRGVKTAETLGEAIGKCPDLIVVRPRMQTYLKISMQITEILEQFSDLVEPFSIDEQFIDVTGILPHYGSPENIARRIQTSIMLQTGIWTRIGISSTKVLAKMACDIHAKKNREGIFHLPETELSSLLWPSPLNKMFGIGSRMTRHFSRMGIYTIGELAQTPLPKLKNMMQARMGKNSDIQAEVYWRVANGLDSSPVTPGTHDLQKAVGHQMTLPRDYRHPAEIDVILLELSEEVCRRCRAKGYAGWVVSAGAQGADFDRPTGFYRQLKLPDPTNITREVYETARHLFYRFWDGQPIRRAGVTLSQLTDANSYQLTLFGDREKVRSLEKATDVIKARYGSTAILRASSLLESGQAKERSAKIGGHYK